MSDNRQGMSRTSTVLRSEAVKQLLGNYIAHKIDPDFVDDRFTGQIRVEVHVKDGVVVDTYQEIRCKRKD